MKSIVNILLFTFLSLSTVAQVNKIDVAFRLFEEGEVAKAHEVLVEAVQEEPYASSAEAWFFKGYITKELYKKDQKGDINAPLREEAIADLKKCRQLDKTKEFDKKIEKQLNYLANTYYTDMVKGLPTVNTVSSQVVKREDALFDNYLTLKQSIGKSDETTDKAVKYYRTIGYLYMQKYEGSEERNIKDLETAEARFKKALTYDSLDVQSIFNIGILHYNDGAHILNNLDYSADLDTLESKLEMGVTRFLKALPYLKKAHELDQNKKEVLKGLAQIYNGLGDLEKEEYYKSKLKELEGTE